MIRINRYKLKINTNVSWVIFEKLLSHNNFLKGQRNVLRTASSSQICLDRAAGAQGVRSADPGTGSGATQHKPLRKIRVQSFGRSALWSTSLQPLDVKIHLAQFALEHCVPLMLKQSWAACSCRRTGDAHMISTQNLALSSCYVTCIWQSS